MKTLSADTLIDLRDTIRAFTHERNWDQFHTPKNLATSVSIESGELLEQFQWLQTGVASELGEARLQEVRHELADVLVYLIRLADKLDIDLAAAVQEKIELNRAKYPADKVKGDSRKYDEY